MSCVFFSVFSPQFSCAHNLSQDMFDSADEATTSKASLEAAGNQTGDDEVFFYFDFDSVLFSRFYDGY